MFIRLDRFVQSCYKFFEFQFLNFNLCCYYFAQDLNENKISINKNEDKINTISTIKYLMRKKLYVLNAQFSS